MDEIWVRLAVIGGALAVTALVTMAIRSRAKERPRRIAGTGLPPGVYLFTSSDCSECGQVRRALTDALGESGFVERRWEQEPGLFHELGVDAVPATMIIEAEGAGTLWPGGADRALAALGP